jgi:predicted ester cyclase
MSIEQNKALVRQLFAALNNGSEAMEATRPAIFASNQVAHFAGQPLDYDAHVQYDTMVFSAFSDIQYILNDLLAEGDMVVARFTARGTHTGTFQGIPATGTAGTVTGIAVYRVSSGKIVEQWLEYDQLGVLQQLGVIPALGHVEA